MKRFSVNNAAFHLDGWQDLQTVHSVTSYDLEFHSEKLLDENVTGLIRAWKERRRSSALDRMIEDVKVQD